MTEMIIYILILSISFIYLLLVLLIQTDKRKSKEKIFKLLDSNLKNGIIENKEDIILLINSINRQYSRNLSLSFILEDYIVERSLSNENEIENKYKLLKEIIKKENEDKPFENLPNDERRLLQSINDSLINDDKESISYLLKELNSVLSTKNTLFERAIKVNKLSIPAAIISIIVTIIFGMLSLKETIDYDKLKKINKEIVIEAKKEIVKEK